MNLNIDKLIQTRVERSLYEAIRLTLVKYEYLPDASITESTSNNAENALKTALAQIEAIKEFSVMPYGVGSSQSKGIKAVPRIVINSRRIMPGELGTPGNLGYVKNPNNPDALLGTVSDYNSVNLHIDVTLVTKTAKQDRVLNYILQEALGTRRMIPFYDQLDDFFCMTQFNYFEMPDTADGIEDKVYSYEIKDLFLYEGYTQSEVSLIQEITINTTLQSLESKILAEGIIIGPYELAESLQIDLSGIVIT